MTLLDRLIRDLDTRLAGADAELAARYPGERGARQPVHTLYVPADRYRADTLASAGRAALAALDRCAAALSAEADVRERVRAKLAAEPVEDIRVDFEDGYGTRPDGEEDRAVRDAVAALGPADRPPYYGIRIKSFEAATRARGLRTLDLFVAEASRTGGLGDGFRVTLAKVTSVDQVEAMVFACACLEAEYGIAPLRFEIQVETPQAVVGPDGSAQVARMLHASEGRCTGLHYGTYDYSAACGIAAAYQSMEHPVADHAKAVMQAAAAGTGVFVSDGSTNVLPVGDHAVSAWRLHARLVRRSLERGFYQGWDLHPAQLPSRYLATYAFFRRDAASAVERVRAYAYGGSSTHLDEPATAAALAGFLLRGVECGALDERELGIDGGLLHRLARREGGQP
ncbi:MULTISPECIES: DUF6986 family protein [unclassified Streptomyces]|uniref:DUF6986 family protein n=1 Tax=unclassified Streptomyces TaxID=2593676 RepID=UPI002E29BBBD|nr:aldolase [Streptomyces sp. NBC_00223]